MSFIDFISSSHKTLNEWRMKEKKKRSKRSEKKESLISRKRSKKQKEKGGRKRGRIKDPDAERNENEGDEKDRRIKELNEGDLFLMKDGKRRRKVSWGLLKEILQKAARKKNIIERKTREILNRRVIQETMSQQTTNFKLTTNKVFEVPLQKLFQTKNTAPK